MLVLFDFDGTLTTRDTLFEFCRFIVGNVRFILGLIFLSPVLVLQRLKLVSAQRAKESFLTYFIGGTEEEHFNNKCLEFVHAKLPALIRPAAHNAIAEYKQLNASVFIVSASPQNWIEPWATALGIGVIATRLQVVDGVITGKIAGKNCNGIEKVNRLGREVDLKDYATIIAYGDSSGDKYMLQLAHQKFFKPFRDKN